MPSAQKSLLCQMAYFGMASPDPLYRVNVQEEALSDNPGVSQECLWMRDSAGGESLATERESLTSGIYLSFFIPSEAAITSPTWRAPRLKRSWVRDDVRALQRQEKRDAKKLFMAKVGPPYVTGHS